MEATAKVYKTSEKQLNWVKANYHQRGGREKQLTRYYFKIHPEINSETFHADLDPLSRLIKLKEYHFQERVKRNTEKFNNILIQKTT
jgi:hypothetical protein